MEPVPGSVGPNASKDPVRATDAPPKQPRADSRSEPCERGETEDNGLRRTRQPEPKDKGEDDESDAAEGCAERIESGEQAAARRTVGTDALFVQLFMSFDEARPGGKNGRKSKEQAADCGAVLVRN
jgi:hypothetical protein